jgi:transposase
VFIRTVKVRSSSGNVHEYVRVVEAAREGGKSVQRVVANLGRKDVLAGVLPQLVRVLKGEPAGASLGGDIEPLESLTWGPMLVARHLFRELGLFDVMDERMGAAFTDRALVLVANRLVRPESRHGLAKWLETDFVCDRAGERFVPQWKQRRRVKVSFAQLQQWYRTLDQIVKAKEVVEEALFSRLRDLFSLTADLVFYDLTSVYFEGLGPVELARYGYSRDGKPQNRQVVVGVVMVNGLPIGHHVFAGNRQDHTTVQEVTRDLKTRFGIKRAIFVGDRGMVTTENLEKIRENGQGYLVGMTRRRREDVQTLIDRATGPWIQCPVGITASETTPVPETKVQEVKSDIEGVRVFVVDSQERLEYERAMRVRAMQKTRDALEGLRKRVALGRLKKPEKIGSAAERILQRSHGYRYFAWEIENGEFKYFDHPTNLERELKYEGKYLIQTEEKDISALDAVVHYKELSDVERAFRDLKDSLGLRPIWLQAERRVRAHIFVAALSFLLRQIVRRRLSAAKSNLSADDAFAALQTIRWVSFRANKTDRVGVTPGSTRARQVLNVLGIDDRYPPSPH